MSRITMEGRHHLVLLLSFIVISAIQSVHGQCNFPTAYTNVKWFTGYDASTGTTQRIRTYSTAINEGVLGANEAEQSLLCTSSVEEPNIFYPETRYFYITEIPGNTARVTCNRDYMGYNAIIIVHADMEVDASNDAIACSLMNFDTLTKQIYIDTSMITNPSTFTGICPFVAFNYQTSFIDQSGASFCVGDMDSLSEFKNRITVKSCASNPPFDYDNPVNNRQFQCLAVMKGVFVDSSNTPALIIASPRPADPSRLDIYCTRYESKFSIIKMSLNTEDDQEAFCHPGVTSSTSGSTNIAFTFNRTLVTTTTTTTTTAIPTTTTTTTSTTTTTARPTTTTLTTTTTTLSTTTTPLTTSTPSTTTTTSSTPSTPPTTTTTLPTPSTPPTTTTTSPTSNTTSTTTSVTTSSLENTTEPTTVQSPPTTTAWTTSTGQTRTTSPLSSTTRETTTTWPSWTTSPPVPYANVMQHVQFCFQNKYDTHIGSTTDRQAYGQHLANQVASLVYISPGRISRPHIQKGSNGNIVFTFDLAPDATWSLPKVGMVIKEIQEAMDDPNTVMYGLNGDTLDLCRSDDLYYWSDYSECSEKRCGMWRTNNMTWQEAGGRCWITQGKYQCECTEDYVGDYCLTPASRGISRHSVIVIIVVIVIAVILITLICVFLCARYCVGDNEDEDLFIYDDIDDEGDSTLKSVYSTLSRGKAVAYNDRTFQGNPVVMETMSLGKGSRYR